MSVTIAHRPHVHLPWRTIGILLGAAMIAAVVLVLASQLWETETGTESTTIAATGGQAVVVSQPESWKTLHTRPLVRPGAGETADVAVATGAVGAGVEPRRGLVEGASLDAAGVYVSEGFGGIRLKRPITRTR